MEFRKGVLQAQEKTRNDFLVVNDELARINNKSGNMKKMEEIGDVLSSLDPHLICELGSEVKLHEKEIGKLEKQLLLLENVRDL